MKQEKLSNIQKKAQRRLKSQVAGNVFVVIKQTVNTTLPVLRSLFMFCILFHDGHETGFLITNTARRRTQADIFESH